MPVSLSVPPRPVLRQRLGVRVFCDPAPNDRLSCAHHVRYDLRAMDWSYRMDKTKLIVASLDDPPDDVEYWLSQPPEERLRALEFMRQIAYGYDPATARLQRVLTVISLEEE